MRINDDLKKYVADNDVGAAKSRLTGLAYIGEKDFFEIFKDSAKYALSELGDFLT